MPNVSTLDQLRALTSPGWAVLPFVPADRPDHVTEAPGADPTMALRVELWIIPGTQFLFIERGSVTAGWGPIEVGESAYNAHPAGRLSRSSGVIDEISTFEELRPIVDAALADGATVIPGLLAVLGIEAWTGNPDVRNELASDGDEVV